MREVTCDWAGKFIRRTRAGVVEALVNNSTLAHTGPDFQNRSKIMRAILTLVGLAIGTMPVAANAKAKPGRYLIDSKAETVLDNATKLTWQRAVVAQTYSWQSGKDYCKLLALAGGGWRLPTVRELRSIVDFGQSAAAIDKDAFPNTSAEALGSATTVSGTASSAWFVIFGSGQSGSNGVTGASRVRCVR